MRSNLAKTRYKVSMPKTNIRRVEFTLGTIIALMLFMPIKSELVWQILFPDGLWRLVLIAITALLLVKLIFGFPLNLYVHSKRYAKKLLLVGDDRTKPYKHFRPQRKRI